jgi:hypothetical protein
VNFFIASRFSDRKIDGKFTPYPYALEKMNRDRVECLLRIKTHAYGSRVSVI